MDAWQELIEREVERYRDGEARLDSAVDADARQRRLTRLANAAYGAGLAYLMLGRRDDARVWLDCAVSRYRESFADAPAGSWGRPIGAIKARILADDWQGAEDEARWTLDAGAAAAESPIGRYAAALALLVVGEWNRARLLADEIRTRDDFPQAVGDALAMIAADTDAVGYVEAIEAVLDSFERRSEFLEDVPVADTVLVLQALAGRRGLVAELASPLLPQG